MNESDDRDVNEDDEDADTASDIDDIDVGDDKLFIFLLLPLL